MPMDLRYHLSTSGVLLALAPVLVIAVDFSAFALPLLVLPIAAVHKSAKLAIQREEESLHDSLTGLPNRTLFHRTASTMLARASATGSSTALMIVDLDHFKEINDTLGHHIGDQVIQAAADRLSGGARRQRDGVPPWWRRVRRAGAGHRANCRPDRCAHRAPDPRSAADCGRRPHRRRGEYRRRSGTRARPRRVDPVATRRRRSVHRKRGAQRGSSVFAGRRPQHRRAAGAPRRPARCDRARRGHRALSAQDFCADGRCRRRRGVGALAASRAWPHHARRLHQPRGAHRAALAPDCIGSRDGARRFAAVANSRADAHRRSQRGAGAAE